MAEIGDIIAGICVILAVLIAIYSVDLKKEIGEVPLFLIEVGLFVGIIAIAIYGQRISRS
ncbi:MAG: hypothetical protein ACXAC7_13350 [Candidatus Hodarchaeales archaeon]|jgi:hypothetical protein